MANDVHIDNTSATASAMQTGNATGSPEHKRTRLGSYRLPGDAAAAATAVADHFLRDEQAFGRAPGDSSASPFVSAALQMAHGEAADAERVELDEGAEGA